MNPITIKNDVLTVAIDLLGAELASIKDRSGTEHLWQGDAQFWQSRAPILFPIVGGLKEDRYQLDGETYGLPKHGFAKDHVFKATDQTISSVRMILSDDDSTRRMYPYAFLFSADFRLCGNSLVVTYTIENQTDRVLYASFGAHEGYACPEGIEAYELRFEQAEVLETCGVDGNLLNNKLTPVLKKGSVLPLRTAYFSQDALVFTQIRSQSVTLARRAGGRQIRVDYHGFPYLGIWTRPGAPYVCIEPWGGLPDETSSSGRIEEKRGIFAVPARQSLYRTHTITLDMGCD